MDMRGEIREHYEHAYDEDARLRQGVALLEYLRTQEVVRRHLREGPLRVLDVGGGTGVHAAWLAEDGHDVVLVDPVERHVEAAGEVVRAEVGDARELAFDDRTFDAVLLLGPLYHLTERADRVRALQEAARVARPGAPIFAAAITRFASLFDGLARGYLFEEGFAGIVERDLREGQHRNPDREPHWFTTAFFHHPEELRGEAADAGLDPIELVGLEGMGGWQRHLAERMDDPADRQVILDAARAIESEPSLLGLSPHLLLVARSGDGRGRQGPGK